MSSPLLVAITIAIAVVIVLIILALRDKGRHAQKLKAEYDEALKSGDRGRALQAGRAYYAALRTGSTLTIYDEQAIANDLKTMD